LEVRDKELATILKWQRSFLLNKKVITSNHTDHKSTSIGMPSILQDLTMMTVTSLLALVMRQVGQTLTPKKFLMMRFVNCYCSATPGYNNVLPAGQFSAFENHPI